MSVLENTDTKLLPDRKRADFLQLIDGQGNFDADGLDAFIKDITLAENRLNYVVVGIIGPRSTGKSTLLNHLFSTSFEEMDASSGRTQTTEGIWLSRAANIEPCTVVMDLEGSDSSERGPDDTSFEKQIAVFALANSDIVLINMWCHDIGREQAASKPLLRIVFEAVLNLSLCRKTTLLFVIRDKTKTPADKVESQIREDIKKIWDNMPNASSLHTGLGDFFDIKVAALSNFEYMPEDFKNQVANLRERLETSTAHGGLAGHQNDKVAGTELRYSMEAMWKTIRDDKNLHVPTHKVLLANHRCDQIAKEKLAEFAERQEWMETIERENPVLGLGERISTLLETLMSEYKDETYAYDENVRKDNADQLLEKALEVSFHMYWSFNSMWMEMVSHHSKGATNKFKSDLEAWAASSNPKMTFVDAVSQFEKAAFQVFENVVTGARVTYAKWDDDAPVTYAKWEDASKQRREQLRCKIDVHAGTVRSNKIHTIVSFAEDHLKKSVEEKTTTLLVELTEPDTWAAILEFLENEVEQAQLFLRAEFEGYELDVAEEESKLEELDLSGWTAVEKVAKEEASVALHRMKDKFEKTFLPDPEKPFRTWSHKDDVPTIAKHARSLSREVLAVRAAIRLSGDISDPVDIAFSRSLGGTHDREAEIKSGKWNRKDFFRHITRNFFGRPSEAADSESLSRTTSTSLTGGSWDGIPKEQTLLTPTECNGIWKAFISQTDRDIIEAKAQVKVKQKTSFERSLRLLIWNGVYCGIVVVINCYL